MNEEVYIEFENYLAKELSSEELSLFENKLQIDLDFKEKFEIYKEAKLFLAHEVSANTIDFKNNLNSISKDYFAENKLIKKKDIQLKSFV
jgi:hypothetical protein